MANSTDFGLYISEHDEAGPSATRLIIFDLSGLKSALLSSDTEDFQFSDAEISNWVLDSICATIVLVDTEARDSDKFLGAFSVYQSAAKPGLGKVIYSLAMSYANSLDKPLMPDPESTTESAYRIWSHFYFISKEPRQELPEEHKQRGNPVLDSVYWKKAPDVNFLAYQNSFDNFLSSYEEAKFLNPARLEQLALVFFRKMMRRS